MRGPAKSGCVGWAERASHGGMWRDGGGFESAGAWRRGGVSVMGPAWIRVLTPLRCLQQRPPARRRGCRSDRRRASRLDASGGGAGAGGVPGRCGRRAGRWVGRRRRRGPAGDRRAPLAERRALPVARRSVRRAGHRGRAGPGQLDRGALPMFGIMAWGVHVNGLVRRADGWHLWVARRAADRPLDPGKLDHLVAGGIPAGLMPRQTLVKEAAEEAGIPATLAAQAVEAGGSSSHGASGGAAARPAGLCRPGTAGDFIPQPADGRWPGLNSGRSERVFETVRDTDDFKFNVNLVLIDLFRRLGLLWRAPPDPAAGSVALQLRHDSEQVSLPRGAIGISRPSSPAGRRGRRAALVRPPSRLRPSPIGGRRTIPCSLLGLLRRLVHGVEDAEIVLGVLEVAFRHHAVAAAGRVAAELEVFLEQLLGGAADAQVRSIAVEDVVSVERNRRRRGGGWGRRRHHRRRHRRRDCVRAYVSCSCVCQIAFPMQRPVRGQHHRRLTRVCMQSSILATVAPSTRPPP